MMHMWMWFGYDVGDFMFNGVVIKTRTAFTICWLVLFFVALMFEASKVYLARVQREAHKKLYPFRSDERRNLLCRASELQASNVDPTTSRTGAHLNRPPFKTKLMVNFYHCLVFVVHNVVGNLLMLAVMVYNVELILAVILGMMAGYFLFGTSMTRLQMECFGTTKQVICTPECDDTAENSTPPLLDSANSSESDFFICKTRTCIQPSHYFPASTSRDGASSELANTTCYYGAKKCPSKVARAKKVQATAHCHHENKEDSPGVEDVQLLKTERQGCCKKKQDPPPECCKKEIVVEEKCCKEERQQERQQERQRESLREDSPQITCCHSKTTAVSSESQEHIVK